MIHVKLKPEVHCIPQKFEIVYVKLSAFRIEYLKMSASDEGMEFLNLYTSQIAIIYILWERSLYKKLVMIEFCNDYNLPNLVEEKTCYKNRKTKFVCFIANKRLREKCPNKEGFLVRIFLFSVFCPNTGKYGPEKTLYFDTFHAVTDVLKLFKTRLQLR